MHLLTWDVLDTDGPTLEIHIRLDVQDVEYAILSHRWGKSEDEVSYDDMVCGRAETKKGYTKLLHCCQEAHRDGIRYAWIDTCCINKSSSAELSEAITSMYAYYERAKLCYAFLDDVEVDATDTKELYSSLTKCLWFTRGWTLQELIVPERVRFYNHSWTKLGYKTDPQLCQLISKIAKVDEVALRLPSSVRLFSVAQRMSWAADRKTTRVEDRAYSLMGIFGVYMPPIYGEGINAFIRLQKAIINTTNDHTIFAWTSPASDNLSRGLPEVSTMLALSPDQFKLSSGFKTLPRRASAYKSHGQERLDYTVTNTGLAIRLPICKVQGFQGLFAAFLACAEGDCQFPFAIFLSASSEMPCGYFWRTNSTMTPIERQSMLWYPADGRESVATQDLYILPRLNSVFGESVEPRWDKIGLEASQKLSWFRGWRPSLVLNDFVYRDLQHVPGPCSDQHASTTRTRRLIMTDKHSELFESSRSIGEPIKYVPRRDPNFSGRADYLRELHESFTTSHTLQNARTHSAIQSCVISGLRGIGKTTLAVEFCYSGYEKNLFEEIFWINASSSDSIRRSFRRLAVELELSLDQSSDEAPVEAVLRWLSNRFRDFSAPQNSETRHPQWLLVFDNVPAAFDLDLFWPPHGFGSILITTRHGDLGPRLGSETFNMNPFAIGEANDFLRTLIGRADDFTVLSDKLGRHPMALSKVGRTLRRSGLTTAKFCRDESFEALITAIVVEDKTIIRPLDAVSWTKVAIYLCLLVLGPMISIWWISDYVDDKEAFSDLKQITLNFAVLLAVTLLQ